MEPTHTPGTPDPVGSIIAAQVGRVALTMFGARSLVRIDSGLVFRVGRNSTGSNMVRVTLTPDDLYRVEALWVSARTAQAKTKAEREGVYAEDLARVIGGLLGMDYRLPTVRRAQ